MSTAPLAAASIQPLATAPKLGFFNKVKTFFEHLFGEAPKWEHMAINVVNFAAPFVQGLLALYAPETLPLAIPIINMVKSDLATLAVMTGDGTEPVTVAIVLQRLQDNLQALLKATAVKNPEQQAKITATVNLIAGEFGAVQQMLPAKA